MKLRFLNPLPISFREPFGGANVMMRADEDHMIRLLEEPTNGGKFSGTCRLVGSKRVEADDNESIDPTQNCLIQRCWRTRIANPLDFDRSMTRQNRRLLDKCIEIGLH